MRKEFLITFSAECLIGLNQPIERNTMKSISLHRIRSASGAVSAEYATVAIAACGAGGILYKILTSGAFASLVTSIIEKAFSWIFNLG
jgi:hypothetical protein